MKKKTCIVRMVIESFQYKCLECKHYWLSRKNKPTECPECRRRITKII